MPTVFEQFYRSHSQRKTAATAEDETTLKGVRLKHGRLKIVPPWPSVCLFLFLLAVGVCKLKIFKNGNKNEVQGECG